ncbi:MAG: carboxypeptidase [Flavobacteriaceae bacterium]|jgi:carboxypeptidase C (cathepsin A)|nr:carboxypeptidase [Flavobacteriaceae bacterium]HAW05830.1 carboxypeptidase [Saprospirales bacterium]MBT4313828.1 carboxypeptidase [Flavobacteriaceae bacterium]MBT5092299.1 carboxypeptidase [Flavobacteriaceae bacterium]MBT5282826.1 carboxypeptidase [Flavobacteriaceae bacterium]|tara:strand:- start:11952 stop:13439 length:1488 start_codon:yes stop_codon:yes gene_type:complete
MNKYNFLSLVLFFIFSTSIAQNREIPVDTIVVTNHTTTIKGKNVSYQAQTGTQPVWNKEGEPIATLFYTYYKRTDLKNNPERPLIFSFNGGPGSASVWMHLAYTGPKILNIDDEGYPVQPYGYKSNPNSILDVADIVFINPVNTGYSRIIENNGKKENGKTFFGINEDITYLAEWLNTFVSRKQRWESPKYLIGESYGGTRVMGLSAALQENQWMYINGVIMVSPADYKVIRVGGPVSSALNLPYYAAAAWFHKKLKPELQQKDLTDMLPEVEDFTINELIPAMAKGGFINPQERSEIASKMALYSGLSEKSILQNNLDVPTAFFWKDLLREEGKTIGRLDSRYLGIDRKDAGMRPDYSAELTSWLHSFTPAINHYIQKELKFKTDIKYNMFGPVRPWNNDNDNTREDLRRAMAENPYMKVLFQSGYYDGATTYFNAKYTMWQVDPSGKMKDRFYFEGYRSGHMMYLRNEDLIKANEDIRTFIENSAAKGKPAKY